ncbi:hypothetical protein [Cryobacterium sp. Hh38]|uniref:hypothetical protein n=1 Tax=Cryobacterium sp. Hh38 TaxID=1259156 RepID=UPI00106B7CE8|nr:hypothetical protein [Cryobacterium sp. Hh38]TFD66079.1 hypothetical protein E3T41_00020 [Cryobacterium sp. Hh38]
MSTTDAPDDNTVTSLTGSEGGLWQVSTRDSTHYFDLDAHTVTRVPGTNATPGINDVARPLRSIDTLTVGRGGRWTMHTDGWSDSIDYYWHESSLVAKIERVISERPA